MGREEKEEAETLTTVTSMAKHLLIDMPLHRHLHNGRWHDKKNYSTFCLVQ